jgi:CDP-diacylglycerol---serine O-phosphatidyltransferase
MNQIQRSVRARIGRLKTLPVLPTLLTAGNLACGVTAILCAAHGRLELGAILIFVAMVCDMLDGKVARLTNTAGPFGAELDSLSDVVSFGVAPALLVHRLVLDEPGVFDHGQRILWFLTVFYPVMAAIRLARYNVEHSDAPTTHFRGLPSPGAAAVVASWVIFAAEMQPWLSQHGLLADQAYAGLVTLDAFRIATLGVLLSCALLMVSTIPYPHLGNTLLGRMSFFSFIAMLLLVVLLVLWPAPVLLLGTTGFALYGVILGAVRAWQNWRRGRGVLDDEEDADAEDVGTGAYRIGRTAVQRDDGPAPGR